MNSSLRQQEGCALLESPTLLRVMSVSAGSELNVQQTIQDLTVAFQFNNQSSAGR